MRTACFMIRWVTTHLLRYILNNLASERGWEENYHCCVTKRMIIKHCNRTATQTDCETNPSSGDFREVRQSCYPYLCIQTTKERDQESLPALHFCRLIFQRKNIYIYLVLKVIFCFGEQFFCVIFKNQIEAVNSFTKSTSLIKLTLKTTCKLHTHSCPTHCTASSRPFDSGHKYFVLNGTLHPAYTQLRQESYSLLRK